MSVVRRKTRTLQLGGLLLGGDAPVLVQSMNNLPLGDVEGNVQQLFDLQAAGCEISRLAVPNSSSLAFLKEIVEKSPLPLVADIHFDHRLALGAIEAGVAALRLNPGNLSVQGVAEVARAAKEAKLPIRVGVNSGSISPRILEEEGGINTRSLCRSALEAVEILEKENFTDICVSLKTPHAPLLIEANRDFASLRDYPLHLGLTESGTVRKGSIRSAAALAPLLYEGIGDTIRLSLSGDPVEEVRAAWQILESLELRRRGSRVISCPGCGRTQVEIETLAEQVEAYLEDLPLEITVAVMGCAVNGPGEAREADLGIAGGKNEYLLFAAGKPLYKVPESEAFAALKKEIGKLLN